MYQTANTLDDLLRGNFEAILNNGNAVRASRGGNRELIGTVLRLTNPRARLSHSDRKGKVFSGLGELLWYLAKSDDAAQIVYYISAYADDAVKGRIHGGYGPRIFAMRGLHNQFNAVFELLKKRKSSRKAVIQLINAEDVTGNHPEIPCTCNFQFLVRDDRLHMVTYMRSNDAFLGLPHDVFAFTMLQEILARKLDVELGEYTHMVGSMHLYEKHEADARQYIDEGWQSTISAEMPAMPSGDPEIPIQKLLQIEADLREGRDIVEEDLGLEPYWADLARLLQAFRYYKNEDGRKIKMLQAKMSTDAYDDYLSKAAGRFLITRGGDDPA